MNYSIWVISNKPEKFKAIQDSLYPLSVNYFDGTNYPSFSKLVNQCTEQAPTEIVIILSDKIIPTPKNIEHLLALLERGYAFAALYRFAFFAFKKELFRQIGPLDERFTGGGFEDYDYFVRMIEAKIAVWIEDSATYNPAPSSWDYDQNMPIWATKWKHHFEPGNNIPKSLTRTWTEQSYNYTWGNPTNEIFLPHPQFTFVGHLDHNILPVFTQFEIITPSWFKNNPQDPCQPNEYSVHCISNNNQPINQQYNLYHTKNFNSYSHFFNYVLATTSHPITIISYDTVTLQTQHIKYLAHNIKKGFGLVAINAFGIIAINPAIIQQTGYMDERFTGLGYEWFDFILKLGGNKIPILIENTVNIEQLTWHNQNNPNHWHAKYTFPHQTTPQAPDIIKNIAEIPSPYKIYTHTTQEFLPTTFSKIDINDGGWINCLYTLGLYDKIREEIK